MSALQIDFVGISQWLSSSSYMTYNLNLFNEYQSYLGKDIFMIENGQHLDIKHIAMVTLSTSSGHVILQHMLHVPQP